MGPIKNVRYVGYAELFKAYMLVPTQMSRSGGLVIFVTPPIAADMQTIPSLYTM